MQAINDFLPPRDLVGRRVFTLSEDQYPQKLNIMRDFYGKVKDWNKTVLYFQDSRITCSDLRSNVNKTANALKSLGVERNDRVVIKSSNVPEFAYCVYACWTIGAIPVYQMHLGRAEEIVWKANDSGAKVYIVNTNGLLDMDEAIPKFETVKHVILIGDKKTGYLSYRELVKDQPEECAIEDTDRDQVVRLLYTSGTTGKPKAAISYMTDMAVGGDVFGKQILGLTEEDVVGGHPNYTFAFGAMFLALPLRCRCALSIVDSPTPEKMFETVEEHRITVLCCVPSFFNSMLMVENAGKRYNLSSLRLCQSAGEWLPGKTYLEWKRRFRVEILDALGSSELGYWISMRQGFLEDKAGSSGVPLPGWEARIVDESLNEVPPNTDGELIVMGPSRQDYWRRPDKQKEAVVQSGKYKGWNRVGLVYSRDEDGFLSYRGRIDDMIVSSAYKIPGGEVENALLAHPAVHEAAIVPSPDPIRGNVVKAFIVVREGYQPSERLIKELQDFVKAKIEPYKYPRIIECVDAAKLPRTSTGKIQRRTLREMEMKGEKISP
ncbi:MAG: AMP-binding protein [Chloroflexota bacterium]